MNLQELMNIQVADVILDETGFASLNKRWRLTYSYRRLNLGGYRRGTTQLSNDDVLFTADKDNRTIFNFPVLPTEIAQEVHTVALGYHVIQDLQFSISLPFIQQYTDHISSIPEFDFFTLTSQGLGDIALNLAWLPIRLNDSVWRLTAGISLPSGSIDKKGDTPRQGVGTEEQLPYTMQPGSGTYDLPLSLSYIRTQGQFSWGGQFSALLRTGKNDRNYRLGNSYSLSIWGRYMTAWWIHPGVRLSYQYVKKIQGLDEDLLMKTGDFPFPATITNPDNFGGNKLHAALLFKICKSFNKCDYYADFEFGTPVYQNLNGIQPEENFQFSLHIGINF